MTSTYDSWLNAQSASQPDPAHRHGGPGAGWYVPGPDGWQRITDAEANEHRYPDMAHFMHDPREGDAQMADLAHASEGDTDLHGDKDAAHWAERFASRFEVRPRPDPGGVHEPDETWSLMLTWFAAAIETGRMVPYAPADDGQNPPAS